MKYQLEWRDLGLGAGSTIIAIMYIGALGNLQVSDLQYLYLLEAVVIIASPLVMSWMGYTQTKWEIIRQSFWVVVPITFVGALAIMHGMRW